MFNSEYIRLGYQPNEDVFLRIIENKGTDSHYISKKDIDYVLYILHQHFNEKSDYHFTVNDKLCIYVKYDNFNSTTHITSDDEHIINLEITIDKSDEVLRESFFRENIVHDIAYNYMFPKQTIDESDIDIEQIISDKNANNEYGTIFYDYFVTGEITTVPVHQVYTELYSRHLLNPLERQYIKYDLLQTLSYQIYKKVLIQTYNDLIRYNDRWVLICLKYFPKQFKEYQSLSNKRDKNKFKKNFADWINAEFRKKHIEHWYKICKTVTSLYNDIGI